jgi:hypothetical protein
VVVGDGPSYRTEPPWRRAGGVVRCDQIEPLPDDFRGGWITNPASIVHMVREPDAW